MAVSKLMSTAREQAEAILKRERKALDALAAELTANEMVNASRLDEILAEAGAKVPPRTVRPDMPAPVVALPPQPQPTSPPIAASRAVRALRSVRPSRPAGPGKRSGPGKGSG
jgi:hypothetical protein